MYRFFNWIRRLFLGQKCGDTGCVAVPAKDPVVTAEPEVIPPPVQVPPVQVPTELPSEYNVRLKYDSSLTPKEIKNVPLIQSELHSFIHSQFFYDYCVNPANGMDLNQTNGMTRPEVVQFIRTTVVECTLNYYYQWTSTVGYRNIGESIIHCNRRFHDYYTTMDSMGNVLHEATHVMGFDHDFRSTARRNYSVPYVMNAAVEAYVEYQKRLAGAIVGNQ